MQDPDHPGPKRKRRAGITIVAIIALVVIAIFIGLNIYNAQMVDEPISPATTTAPSQGG